MASKIFISYSRKDIDVVLKLRDEIHRVTGVLPWMDVTGIETGSQFADVIARNIDGCELLVFVISFCSVESQWTRKEVLYAQNHRKKIYPVVIDDVQLPRELDFLFSDVDRVDVRDGVQRRKFFSDLIAFCGAHSTRTESSIGMSHAAGESFRLASRTRAEGHGFEFSKKEADRLYSQGRYQQVAEFYLQLAANGDVEAQSRLADMYFNGRGVAKDDKEAMKWVRRAAAQGDVWAKSVVKANSFRSKVADFMDSEAFAYFWVFIFFGLIAMIIGFYVWSRFF